MIKKLIEMDKDIRTYSLLGYFFTLEFFIFFFFLDYPWLMFFPFIFIGLLIYTSGKAEELEKLNLTKKENESI